MMNLEVCLSKEDKRVREGGKGREGGAGEVGREWLRG